METTYCIFCGDAGTRPYHAENGYQAVACDGCGLVFVTPRPSEAEMKHLYEGQETKIDLGRQIGKIEAATLEARRALDHIRRYIRGGRILEIGSAAGYFLREAERQGFKATGIDITRQFVEFARDVQGLDAREGTLMKLPLEAGSYDVVYHRNVLSHLAYPIDEFKRMRELLKPSGLMVFETGNVAELPGSRWAGTNDLDLPDHLFHYGERQIRMLLERTGFTPIEVHRCALVAHDPWVRALVHRAKAGFARRSGKGGGDKATPPPPFTPPREVPPWRRLKEASVALEQLLTYDIGAAAPSEGRRCTLIFIARAEP